MWRVRPRPGGGEIGREGGTWYGTEFCGDGFRPQSLHADNVFVLILRRIESPWREGSQPGDCREGGRRISPHFTAVYLRVLGRHASQGGGYLTATRSVELFRFYTPRFLTRPSLRPGWDQYHKMRAGKSRATWYTFRDVFFSWKR